ncbi:hypothetical protein [Rhodococcus sp. NBC_00294]|uniref:hypothetical protein n=1 Tax=Rhodococcus sp. NBC_00294 TaxID=2976004 RepID=UPI002E2C8F86|nr:hypothetical protein [Rhodococcus sp. NBC_00294]
MLWNEPAYASTARAGSYRTLRDTLIGILEETSEPADAVASADAVMAILGGVLTIPGDRHGLADSEVGATVHRLIAPRPAVTRRDRSERHANTEDGRPDDNRCGQGVSDGTSRLRPVRQL